MRLTFFAAAIAFSLLPCTVRAQQTSTPALDQVLTGVHNNFLTYLATVPNLIADEHVSSTLHRGSGALLQIGGGTTDSIFRMRRGEPKNGTVELIESREAKGLHGGQQQVNGPSVAVGLFSYGALDISPSLKSCYDFRLESKPQQLRHTTVLIVDYTLREKIDPTATCPVTEPVSGRAFVDPGTMQLLRVEQTRPKHDVFQGRLGTWSWSVDYALADLDGKTFWLPDTISAQSVMSGLPHTEWSFIAKYSNYHLLAVRTTILPTTAAPVQ